MKSKLIALIVILSAVSATQAKAGSLNNADFELILSEFSSGSFHDSKAQVDHPQLDQEAVGELRSFLRTHRHLTEKAILQKDDDVGAALRNVVMYTGDDQTGVAVTNRAYVLEKEQFMLDLAVEQIDADAKLGAAK